MNLLQALKLRCFRFGGDSRGSVPTEGVMAFTFLIWWYISSFQFFDAYRQKNINLKAAYTIADLISRETEMIDAGYIDGLNTVFDYLTYSRKPTWIRVSSVYWDEDTDSYRVWWSYSTGGHSVHTDATIDEQRNRIPVMPVGDTVVLVETNMAYEQIFRMGLDARWYETFIVTRPRFASQVVFDESSV